MTMWTTRGIFLTVAVLTTVVPSAIAQEPLAITLEDAVTRGLAEAPRVNEARAREQAAEATVSARSALGRPALTASAGYLRTNHVDEFGVTQPDGSFQVIFPDIPNKYRARAEMTVPLYTAGRVGGLVTSAEAARRATDAERRTTSSDVRLEIVSAYWNLVFTRARVGVLERALERADVSLATVRVRVQAGVLPPNDVFSAEAQRARQLVGLIQSRNDAAIAEAELGRLMGVSPGQAINPVTPVDRPTPGVAEIVALSTDVLVTRAKDTRPERLALTERQASMRAAAEAAVSATRPQVNFLAAVEPMRPNLRWVPPVDRWNTGWDLGVGVTWGVLDGGRAKAERASTVAEAEALRYRTAEFDAHVGVDVKQRVLDIEAGRAALVASNDAVNAAAEARRVLGERFTAGVAENTDVLEADQVWLEAELERTRLQIVLRLNEARLLKTVGDR